jgi:hypothetical protein
MLVDSSRCRVANTWRKGGLGFKEYVSARLVHAGLLKQRDGKQQGTPGFTT